MRRTTCTAFCWSGSGILTPPWRGWKLFCPTSTTGPPATPPAPRYSQKHTDALLEPVRRWIGSQQTYTVRYGMGMLMRYYLDEAFRPEYLDWAGKVQSEEYYVRMMAAWFFATALAKQPQAALALAGPAPSGPLGAGQGGAEGPGEPPHHPGAETGPAGAAKDLLRRRALCESFLARKAVFLFTLRAFYCKIGTMRI